MSFDSDVPGLVIEDADVEPGSGRQRTLATGLAGVVAKRGKPRTAVTGDAASRPRDLVQRDFRAPAPNRLWVTHITYVELAGGGFCYPAFVTDVSFRQGRWRVNDQRDRYVRNDVLGRARPAFTGQLTLTAVSSTTKEVWSMESSLPVNFSVTVWPA
jgi:putative transposase